MKNFQLNGIANKVQFGETGLIIKSDGTTFLFRNSSDSAYVKIKALNPTQSEDVVTLQYLINSLPSIPVNSKGDIFTHDGTDSIKIGVGANGQVLKANSSSPTGLEWADETGGVSYTSPITTKGDLFVGSSVGNDGRLPIGANDFILVPDSTQPNGLKWISLASHTVISGITSDITAIENDILGINVVLNDHETRITTLEGSGGSGSTNGVIFRAYLYGGVNGVSLNATNGSPVNILDEGGTYFVVSKGLSIFDVPNMGINLGVGIYRVKYNSYFDFSGGSNTGFNKLTAVLYANKISGSGVLSTTRYFSQASFSEDELIAGAFTSFKGTAIDLTYDFIVVQNTILAGFEFALKWTGTTSSGFFTLKNPNISVEKIGDYIPSDTGNTN